jgi:hypothetical protein
MSNMRKLLVEGLLAVVMLTLVALPGIAAGVSIITTAATITVTSGNCLAARTARSSLTLDATGSAANIGYCQGATCTAAIGVTGTTTLALGTLHFWPAESAPRDGFCFISASGSQPMTIREGIR